MHHRDLTLGGGGTLHVHDTGAGPDLRVLWHHRTPNTGGHALSWVTPAQDRMPWLAQALLPGRVTAVVCGASMAPYAGPGLDYFAGMAAPSRIMASMKPVAVANRVRVSRRL